MYTTDFLSKKKKKNEGEVSQYYVEGNHEAIIPPAVFDNVQVLMQSRGKGSSRNSCVSIFSSKIRCGDCGSWYAMVNFMTVYGKDDVRFTFKNGMEIKA